MSKVSHYIFSHKCSYFDVFAMGLSLQTGSAFGYWIGFWLLMALTFISYMMYLRIADAQTKGPT